MGSFGRAIDELIAKIEVPVLVLRAPPRSADSAAMGFAASPTWPELASQFANGKDVLLPELTHFMPMQDPQLIADYIIAG